ncbi:MAG: Holliday junction branch migration protein RuvA, partial [Acidimicrobiia bacterium]
GSVIGVLRGTVMSRGPDKIVLGVGGVGFEITMTPRDLGRLAEREAEMSLHTHLHVREDALDLYGFVEQVDRDLFRLLLGASGVGPKLAMAMMASLRTDEIRRAVVSEDAAALTVVPGIGSRSAQKLILELRPRIVGVEADVMGSGTRAQIRDALEGLGYAPTELREVVASLPEDLSVEESLRLALKELGKR